MLCFSSRNMIDKTMCEVLWRNISDFCVNLWVEVGKPLPPLEFDECYIYVISIHLFDSGILLIIDLNKKKEGSELYLWILQLNKCYISTV